MTSKIHTALAALDPANDDHWTADGLPKIEALKLEGVKRADVTTAAPHFRRDNPQLDPPPPKQPEANPEVKTAEKPSLEELRAVASRDVTDTLRTLNTARAAHDKALARLDDVERAISNENGGRSEQQTIMDYLEAQRIRREQR